MTDERKYSRPGSEQGDAQDEPPEVLADPEDRQRADNAEDRRRQQELDYGELGGEA